MQEFLEYVVKGLVENPGAVTYSTPGKYTAMLTVTDNQGVVDPNPPTRTITVQSGSNGSNTINFGTGFSAAGLQLNGYAQLNGTRLQVTNTTTSGESGSAFWTSQANITNGDLGLTLPGLFDKAFG